MTPWRLDQAGAGQIPKGRAARSWFDRAKLGNRFAVDGDDDPFTVFGSRKRRGDLVAKFAHSEAMKHYVIIESRP